MSWLWLRYTACSSNKMADNNTDSSPARQADCQRKNQLQQTAESISMHPAHCTEQICSSSSSNGGGGSSGSKHL
jgi:hypothetical protein